MKKIFYFILAGLAIASCATKEATTAVDPNDLVDLRYRVGKDEAGDEDSRYTEETSTYSIESTRPGVISIVVKSSKPWSIRSTHPTWCTIDVEGGKAVADSLVHVGKGENTPIKIQYYDNVNLDDRLDTLIIYSDYWIGKKVFVNQAGVAYLNVENKNLEMKKTGDDVSFDILSNQDWSVEVIEGKGDSWLSVKEGATGNGNGTVTLSGLENAGEQREGSLCIRDRHGNKMRWQVKVTQDGIELKPTGAIQMDEDQFEVRGFCDQEEIVFAVDANTEWSAAKKKATDTWFSFADADPKYQAGKTNLKIKLQKYEGTEADGIREATIILKTTPGESGVYVSKEVKIRQGYNMSMQTVIIDTDEMTNNWESDYDVEPQYKPELGGLFFGVGKSRLESKSAKGAPGKYKFYWSNLTTATYARVWFLYTWSDEIKINIDYTTSKATVEINNADKGPDPTMTTLDLDTSVTSRTMTLEVTPIAKDFVHVVYRVDDSVVMAFDTSEDVLSVCRWGTGIKHLYIGTTKGSAVLEKYEYTPAFNAW